MLHNWKMNHLKFPFCSSLCRPRPLRCGSSPSWTNLTPWASSTARPTCRPSLLLGETSMLPLRDCWAHSPLKDIQYNLTHTHSLIHTYIYVWLVNTLTHSQRNQSVSSETLQENFGQPLAELEFFLCSQIIFLISILSFFSRHHPNRSLS